MFACYSVSMGYAQALMADKIAFQQCALKRVVLMLYCFLWIANKIRSIAFPLRNWAHSSDCQLGCEIFLSEGKKAGTTL